MQDKILARANPVYRLRGNVSKQIHNSLVDGKKGRSWEKLVGYSIIDLKNSIERQFKDGMSWDNYGEWHIDHEIPNVVFNYKSVTDIDFKKCWALSNLQPMWAEDNLKKGAKLEKPFQPSFAFG